MMSDHFTNERLFITSDESMDKALELGDQIVISVLLMRETGLRAGGIKGSHQEWFDHLLKQAKEIVDAGQ